MLPRTRKRIARKKVYIRVVKRELNLLFFFCFGLLLSQL